MRRGRRIIPTPDQLPLFVPESSWKPPTELPDLSAAEYIGLDTEGVDPRLKEQGPGFIRGDAKVCGVSLATELGHKLYLPFGHREDNLDKAQVVNYLTEQLRRPHQKKVMANAPYDLEALWSLGIKMEGELHDIQVAEPLLDADRAGGYGLDVLAKCYLGKGKNTSLLKEAEVCFGVEHMKGMNELPARFVGPYAEEDADDALQIFLLQLEELQADDLTEIYELEQQLMPVLFEMRLKGVRVDVDRAEQLGKEIRLDEQRQLKELFDLAGRRFEFTGPSLEPTLSERGLIMGRTATGLPSLTNDWLLLQKDELCKGIVKYRKTVKMRSDFIEGSILKHNVKGRLHTRWQQLRGYDEESESFIGVAPGRIASKTPNLTQIPARDPYWGPLIRSLFIADEGGQWTHADYSQQEPRIFIHFACQTKLKGDVLAGAWEARQRYIDDPDTDYHQLVCDLIHEKSGKDIGRRSAKAINLGSSYGMGREKMARQLNVSIDVATEILRVYHEGVPYVRQLSRACMERAIEKGYIRTILGRKQRFPLWEPFDFDKKFGATPVKSQEEAIRLWGPRITRADANTAVNKLVQGSAADQTKRAIILLHAEGLTPQIQVYDELNRTSYSNSEVRRMQEIMEHAVPQFCVPFKADPDLGPSWGELTAYKWVDGAYVAA